MSENEFWVLILGFIVFIAIVLSQGKHEQECSVETADAFVALENNRQACKIEMEGLQNQLDSCSEKLENYGFVVVDLNKQLQNCLYGH